MILAIKGSIGTGKSTLAKELATRGYDVVNCDEIVHNLYNDNVELIEKINNEFELDQKKKLFSFKKTKAVVDRQKLGEIVFNNPEKMAKLEAMVHPVLKQEMLEKINASSQVVIDCQVVDKLELEYDMAIYLYAEEKEIIRRVQNRDGKDEELIKKIMNSQIKKELLTTRTYAIDSTLGIEHVLKELGKIKELKHD